MEYPARRRGARPASGTREQYAVFVKDPTEATHEIPEQGVLPGPNGEKYFEVDAAFRFAWTGALSARGEAYRRGVAVETRGGRAPPYEGSLGLDFEWSRVEALWRLGYRSSAITESALRSLELAHAGEELSPDAARDAVRRHMETWARDHEPARRVPA